MYPRNCPQPIKESYLLTGPLEPTNEMYAVAKIAGIKLCEGHNHQYGRQYVSVMPTSLYGLNDNYDLNNSHVLPALIHKAHKAKLAGEKTFSVWGTGTPKREFLFVDDLADALTFLMENDYTGPLINIGTGVDETIREVAETVLEVVDFRGDLQFDSSKPDGTPRKLLDVSALHDLGWKARTSLKDGLTVSYKDFQARYPN
jgi:GDP-L-fucose synthase